MKILFNAVKITLTVINYNYVKTVQEDNRSNSENNFKGILPNRFFEIEDYKINLHNFVITDANKFKEYLFLKIIVVD